MAAEFPWDKLRSDTLRNVCRDLGLKYFGVLRDGLIEQLEAVSRDGLEAILGGQPAPVLRKRGRPPKRKIENNNSPSKSKSSAAATHEQEAHTDEEAEAASGSHPAPKSKPSRPRSTPLDCVFIPSAPSTFKTGPKIGPPRRRKRHRGKSPEVDLPTGDRANGAESGEDSEHEMSPAQTSAAEEQELAFASEEDEAQVSNALIDGASSSRSPVSPVRRQTKRQRRITYGGRRSLVARAGRSPVA
ncbi:hypothetical protein K474DRAFT_1678511 [Panus rudis PR-1116 ss-1]|nr:hypothetical protein K474DRAFT_1678511 [Panus rudis PR-1116 ss-1]